MLRFEVRPFIRHVKIQRADHFLCYVSRSALSLDMLKYRGRTISYATIRGPPFIRHVRSTEGGSFLMLHSRFALSLDMLEIPRWDQFLWYVFGSALSLDMLDVQRADHFLALSLDMLEIQRADHLLCYDSRSALSLDM